MKLTLIQFENTNRVLLPGLLYQPDTKNDKIAIRLHGNGSSGGFYSVQNHNTLGEAFTNANISYLSFTNTGGHLIQKFDQVQKDGTTGRIVGGSAYELIKDCIPDIDGVIRYVKSLGYKHLYLIGVSTGANKIAVYNKYKPDNDIKKFILESGGDDAGSFYAPWGNKKFTQVLDKCQEMIDKGHSARLVSRGILNYTISYQSLYDQINPEGDYNVFPFYWQLNNIAIMKKEPFGEIKKIKKPTLVIYGGVDEYCYGRVQDCVDLIKKATEGANNFDFNIVPEADHGFTNHWQELANRLVEFISK